MQLDDAVGERQAEAEPAVAAIDGRSIPRRVPNRSDTRKSIGWTTVLPASTLDRSSRRPLSDWTSLSGFR